MNRWYFWVLAPIMLTTAIGLPFWTDPPTFGGRVVLYVFCLALLSATLGLANPRRFGWALKPVAAAILLGYIAYFATEFLEWRAGKPAGLGSQRSGSNLFNAICGLVVFGVPSLMFLLSGRSGSSVDVLLDEPGTGLDEREPEEVGSDGEQADEADEVHVRRRP